jgi:hypothetical protein
MSFTDHLLLWLHVGFAIFTLGPVAAAMGATPRYIRKRDLPVLRYLYRTTRMFGLLTLGVLFFGLILGRSDLNQAWLSASMTLFVVSVVLLVLVVRDQHRAIAAIEKVAAERAVPVPERAVPAAEAEPVPANTAGEAHDQEGAPTATPEDKTPEDKARGGEGSAADPSSAAHIANVERGRIASLGGVISAIWLVVLVLMVWHA